LYCLLRPSLRLIAIYATICLFWVGFAGWFVPRIVAIAFDEPNLPTSNWVFRSGSALFVRREHWTDLSIINWVFQDRRPLPIEYFLNRWSVIAVAALLAATLHLLTVLFIYHIDHKHRVRFLDAERPSSQPRSRPNATLIMFSAAFLAFTVLSGSKGDYPFYLDEWMTVLAGDNPWTALAGGDPWAGYNTYGPLFNLLAPLAWVNPFANKLLFSFSYLIFVIWLIKDFAPHEESIITSWTWAGLWLLNPFPWEQIAYYGYFDILVSLTCVAAVHSLVNNKNRVSGISLASGILLKYLPIAILPFLVFSGRRFHFRLLSFCVGAVILGLVVSVLIWGTSTFLPLTFAAVRTPVWSIYNVLTSTHSPLRTFLGSPNIDWLEKGFLLTAGLALFTWCTLRQIEPALSSALAILVTLLFYRVGYGNYQMVLFSLILYWAVSNWGQFKEHSVLVALLICYFGFLAFENSWKYLLEGSIFYSKVILLQFLLGCALFVGLVRLRPR
jgi:hypothetical protein